MSNVVAFLLRALFPTTNVRQRRRQIVAMFLSVRKQIPLLYAVALLNLVGLYLTIEEGDPPLFSPIYILVTFFVWRVMHWVFLRNLERNYNEMRDKLIHVVIYTVGFSFGLSIWAQLLITDHPDQVMAIALYTVLAALGAAYGLGSFPRAAALPLIILGMPVAIRLFFINDISVKIMALNLFFVLFLFMWLLRVHGNALFRLVTSNIEISDERNRAVINEMRAIERADHDVLTGLANRSSLSKAIGDHRSSKEKPNNQSTLAIIDLDNFKSINDMFGHAAGDHVLRVFAKRLRTYVADNALPVRLGGDEFAVFWPTNFSGAGLEAICDDICALAEEPIFWRANQLLVQASCGISHAEIHQLDDSEFMRRADAALYIAKSSGSRRWHVYDEPLFASEQRKARIEDLISSSPTLEEIYVNYQPIIESHTGNVKFAEALARWENPELGRVYPDEFIRAAERRGEVEALNESLLRMALQDVTTWPHDLNLSFNLSAVQLGHDNAAERLVSIVRESGVSPERIQFEITETAILTDLRHSKSEMNKLSDHGFTIALDDFGSGFASVSYLRGLTFDVIKLDGSFLVDVGRDLKSRQILLGLADLCHAAGAKCVAENVENFEQFKIARSAGCDFVQGFYFGRPTSSDHLLSAIKGGRHAPWR
ncbi:MAG: EAL domain-containing protein [Sphingomonadaceae bacterium]